MYDRYLICDDSLRNTGDGTGEASGYEVEIRIAYYRGLGLSMVEGLELTVDGEGVEAEDMAFTVHGNRYELDQLEAEGEDRWGFTERATLTVRRPGGLSVGGHLVSLTERLRISYIPMPSVTTDTKTLSVRGPEARMGRERP
jgi:hypothetical protein